ncbi:MAG: sigma 54-interacting transcriptional regulator [Thermincola sp.]|nr:sigma 54-interacting transcriptional regulator [Thermincola sp.]MDT3704592.1 sigma 54-interacting transcriptional regulator [Thermincola sp.]
MSIHIAFLGREELITAMENTPAIEGVKITAHAGLEDEVPAMALGLQRTGADLIVTSGRNLKTLQNSLHIPVIAIRITFEDIVRAVVQGLPFGRKMAIVTSMPLEGGDTNNLHMLEELFKITLSHTTFSENNNLEELFGELKKTGVEVVIGATPLLVEKQGMKGISIYTLEGVIHDAILRAVEIVKAKYHEEERSNRFKTILDSVYEGIIMTDDQGVINYCNSIAVKILKVKQENIIGESLARFFTQTHVENTHEPEYGIIEHFGDSTAIINHVPVKVKNQITGIVTTFQDITRIQELENTVRLNTHAKGLHAKITFDQIIGESKAIQKIIAVTKKYAESDFTILIEGETGCGKEMFAQSIHNHSKRHIGPFVAINCSALPENLLESELFGYNEGAFTSALKQGKKGLFELAHNGTIFLDEISSVSQGFQLKLLRVIQEREIMRIGSDKVIPINVRIIAATNENLGLAVSKRTFRSDLYFRLNVLTLILPPLRQRMEDIPVLLRHFLNSIDPQLLPRLEPSYPEIVAPLLTYNFPGNVRELISIAQRFLIMLDQTRLNEIDYLKELIRECIGENLFLSPSPNKVVVEVKESISATMEEIEKEVIVKALNEENGDKAKAARKLGLSRTTLYRKMSTLGITKDGL